MKEKITFKRNNITGTTYIYINNELSKYCIQKIFRTNGYSIKYNDMQIAYVGFYKEAQDYIIERMSK